MTHISAPLRHAITDYLQVRRQARSGLVNAYVVAQYRERLRAVYRLQKLFHTPT